jgi:prevent-host-death family protein
MTTRTLSITQARNEITGLAERFAKDPTPVEVTRRGRPVMAVIPWDVYEGMVETLEIMQDTELVGRLRKSMEEMARGKVVSLAAVKREFGI